MCVRRGLGGGIPARTHLKNIFVGKYDLFKYLKSCGMLFTTFFKWKNLTSNRKMHVKQGYIALMSSHTHLIYKGINFRGHSFSRISRMILKGKVHFAGINFRGGNFCQFSLFYSDLDVFKRFQNFAGRNFRGWQIKSGKIRVFAEKLRNPRKFIPAKI